MPGVQVRGPQRERNQGVGELAQRTGRPEVQQRLDHRPGDAEDDQQRAEVADHEVLRHVKDQHLVGQRVQWPDLDRGEQEPRRRRNDAIRQPEHGPAFTRQRCDPVAVQGQIYDGRDRRRKELGQVHPSEHASEITPLAIMFRRVGNPPFCALPGASACASRFRRERGAGWRPAQRRRRCSSSTGRLITVALPSVAHGLGVSNGSTAVVLSAYFVAYAIALLPGGSLVDRFGARRLALPGLGLFALGAALGAVAPTMGVLIAVARRPGSRCGPRQSRRACRRG